MSTIKTEVEIDICQIVNLLVSACEGGSNYWVESYTKNPPAEFKYRSGDFLDSFYNIPLNEGGSIEVHVIDEEDIDGIPKHNICLERIKIGLSIMHNKYPHHYSEMLNGNSDASTGDVFLQCVVFGDVIFG